MAQPALAESIFKKIAEAVENGDENVTASLAREAIDKGVDPGEAIERGFTEGVLAVGDRWASGRAFITEVMLSAAAMKAGLQVLEPALTRQGRTRKTLGRVLLGTVQGDIHDIGKSIVGAMLTAAGFDIIDLGVDVPPAKFIEEIPKAKPEIIGLSSLLTVSMPIQKEIIDALKREELRDSIKVMIGGAPVTEAWAREIGADAFGEDALDAIKKAKKLLRPTEA